MKRKYYQISFYIMDVYHCYCAWSTSKKALIDETIRKSPDECILLMQDFKVKRLEAPWA